MNTAQEAITSIKYGLCQAMSEYGFSPQDVETLLEKNAFDIKNLSPLGIMTPAFTLALGGGALAGVGTAALRHKADQIGQGTEDKEMKKSRMKVDMYKKMIADLQNDMATLQS
jgi:hypothetical protein